jgi:hypothetical protein
MSNDQLDLITELERWLREQRYHRVVIQNYCRRARHFLRYLTARNIALEAVTPALVSRCLRHAVRNFRERRNRVPAPRWILIPRSGIHALLRQARGYWPIMLRGPPGSYPACNRSM